MFTLLRLKRCLNCISVISDIPSTTYSCKYIRRCKRGTPYESKCVYLEMKCPVHSNSRY